VSEELKLKLRNLSKGETDDTTLRKIFHLFDVGKRGYLSVDELQAMMKRLEIPVEEKYLANLFHILDQNNSGNIEYEEFTYFIRN